MSIETVKYPGAHLQPGLVDLLLKLTGAGAAQPTAASAADTDNRLVSATARSGVGAYTITLSQWGRVFMGASLISANIAGGADGTVIGHSSFNTSTGVLSIRLFKVPTVAGNAAAVDLAANDTLTLRVTFKNSGAT